MILMCFRVEKHRALSYASKDFVWHEHIDMKLLYKALLILFIFISIGAGILWGLTKQLKPETLKPYLHHQLVKLSGSDSQIDGSTSWHLYPSPGISITNIKIGSESGPYFLNIKQLDLNLKLSQLVRGQLLFNEVKINGLQMVVHKNQNPAVILDTNNRYQHYPSFLLEHFLLSHGELIYRQDNTEITLSNIQLGAESLNFENNVFPIQVKANLHTRFNENTIKGLITFKGKTCVNNTLIQNPFHRLHDYFLDGQLNLQNVKTNFITLENVNANIALKEGQLQVRPLAITFYQGQSVGYLKYHFDTNELNMSQTATHLNAKNLSQDLFKQSLITGNLDISVQLKTWLNLEWQKHLIGSGRLYIKDGEIAGFDINELLENITEHIKLLFSENTEEANAVLKNNALKDSQLQQGQTSFSLISIPFQIKQGIIKSDTPFLQTNNLQIKGQGQVDLTNLEIKGQLNASLLKIHSNIKKIQNLLDGSFPILVSGTLLKPIFQENTALINPLLTKSILKYTFTKPLTEDQ